MGFYKGDKKRVLKSFRLDQSTVDKIIKIKKKTGKSEGEVIDEKFKD